MPVHPRVRRPARAAACRAITSVVGALLVGACASHAVTVPSVNARVSAATSATTSPERWEGALRPRGSAPLPIAVTLERAPGAAPTSATAAGVAWRGAISTAAGGQPIAFTSVTRTADSLVLQLPASANGQVLRGRISGDARRFDGVVDGAGAVVTFATARAGTPEAAAFAAEFARVDASRQAADRLADAARAESSTVRRATDPDSARLVTSDIPHFWAAVDRAAPESLAAVLQREYLDRGSAGVWEFIPGRIMSAEDLAAAVRDGRARYDSARPAMAEVTRAEPGIRAAFRRFKVLYPAAVFPNVYFVVGRFNSGGTSTAHGLLIGAEIQRDPAARLPALVAHELIHFQQHGPQHGDTPMLLGQSFNEGVADFLGEMASGAQINNDAHRYGLAHEHALWQEFRQHLDDRTFSPWLYSKPPGDRPNDLGYFVGYRIAQAYYRRAPDKRQAIRDLITPRGGDVKAVLAASGYDP